MARVNTEVLLFVSDPAAPGSASLVVLHDAVGNAGAGGAVKIFVTASRNDLAPTVIKYDDPGAKNASKPGDWLG